MEVRQLVKPIMNDVIDIRRKIHRFPETGTDCPKTIDLICQELDKLNLEYQRLSDNGVIAEIHGGKPGNNKTVMLRADMDALDVKEESNLEYASIIENKMHACGHDMHTAMLLGTARILNDIKDQFSGNIRLLFQTGEEISKGADFLISNGALDNVDMGFAIHVDPLSKCHKISARKGADWAGVDHFIINVKGKGGHGATPHKTADATIAACSIALNLQTIVSRRADPTHPLVVTIGQIHSGSAYNIISENAFLEGTCRCFDDDIYNLIPEALNNIASDTAKAMGCEAEVILDRICIPLVNDDKAYEIMRKSAEKIMLDKDDFFENEKAMLGEDFALYAKMIPCIYVHLGADGGYPLHNCHINFKEETMETGIALEVQFALDALEELE